MKTLIRLLSPFMLWGCGYLSISILIYGFYFAIEYAADITLMGSALSIAGSLYLIYLINKFCNYIERI